MEISERPPNIRRSKMPPMITTAVSKKNRRKFTLEKFLGSVGWIVVTVSALTLSGWSLYAVGRAYGLPIPLAAIVSCAYDGAAIVLASLALRIVRTHGDSGLGPRLGVFVMAGLSAYLNSDHAAITHQGLPARVLYSVPPIVALMVLETSQRFERRGALKRAGRIAKSLPVFGRWAWFLFPGRTIKTMRQIVDYRMQLVASAELPTDDAEMRSISVDARKVRAWALDKGISLSDRGRIPNAVMMAYLAEITVNVEDKPTIAGAMPEIAGPMPDNVALLSRKLAPIPVEAGENVLEALLARANDSECDG